MINKKLVWHMDGYQYELYTMNLTDLYRNYHDFEPIDEEDLTKFFYEIDKYDDLVNIIKVTKNSEPIDPRQFSLLDIKKGSTNMSILDI